MEAKELILTTGLFSFLCLHSFATSAPEFAPYLFSAKGADLFQPGATPQEASHLPYER